MTGTSERTKMVEVTERSRSLEDNRKEFLRRVCLACSYVFVILIIIAMTFAILFAVPVVRNWVKDLLGAKVSCIKPENSNFFLPEVER